MGWDFHRRLLALLLTVFALLNIGICFVMLREIPFREFETDAFGRGVSWLVFVIVWASIILLFFQLAASYFLLRKSPNYRVWGTVGSVIALLGGISLPVGAYGIWMIVASTSDTDRST